MKNAKFGWLILMIALVMLVAGGVFAQAEPDRDGDGVPDSLDQCISDPGPIENNGCPVLAPPPQDSDNDGVPDVNDQCPAIPGPSESSGCPVTAPPLLVTPELPIANAPPVFPASVECLVTPITGTVNVRQFATTESDIVATLSTSEFVIVLYKTYNTQAELWYRTLLGYIRADTVVGNANCDTVIAVIEVIEDAVEMMWPIDLLVVADDPSDDPNFLEIELEDLIISSFIEGGRGKLIMTFNPDFLGDGTIAFPAPSGAATTVPSTPSDIRIPPSFPCCGSCYPYMCIVLNIPQLITSAQASPDCPPETLLTRYGAEFDLTAPDAEPVGLLLPAVQAAREAARRSSAAVQVTPLRNITQVDPDPCQIEILMPSIGEDGDFEFFETADGTQAGGVFDLIRITPPVEPPTAPRDIAAPDEEGATEGIGCHAEGGYIGCTVSIGDYSFSAWYDTDTGTGQTQTCVPNGEGGASCN